jgi:hypothetical protein
VLEHESPDGAFAFGAAFAGELVERAKVEDERFVQIVLGVALQHLFEQLNGPLQLAFVQ